MHDIGVNLAQRDDLHLRGADRAKELLPILGDAFARIPFRESQIQDFLLRFLAEN